MQTEYVEEACKDLVQILKSQLPHHDQELVEMVGLQYFSGTLSRLLALSKELERVPRQSIDMSKYDLQFKLMFPDFVDPQQVAVIREKAAQIMAGCMDEMMGAISNQAD